MGIALRIECPCVRLVRRAKLAKDEKETCLMNVVMIPSVLTMCNKDTALRIRNARAKKVSLVPKSPPPSIGDKSVRAIATWVLRLPVPQVTAHRRQVLLRTEPELLFRKGRVGSQIWNVATPDGHRRRHDQLGLRRRHH